MLYQFDHFGVSEHFCIEKGTDFSFPVHLHHSFEFIVVEKGSMTVTVDTKEYTLSKGEAVLVFPNQIHSLDSTESKHTLWIFSPELVKAFSVGLNERVPDDNKFVPSKHLLAGLKKLSKQSSIVEKKGVLYSLCSEFEKNAVFVSRKVNDYKLLYEMFSFVEQHYMKVCNLYELAKELGYSYSYLSRCFKSSTGLSFNTYVNRYRINKACYLLCNTDFNILKCAYESGYESLRSFNRNFVLLMNISPNEYRKNITEKAAR